MSQGIRLISFLGTGEYDATRYFWPGDESDGVITPHVVFALAHMLRSDDVWIAGTRAAWQKHADAICEEFTRGGLSAPNFKTLQDGSSADELWENFTCVRELMDGAQGRAIVLDITHGFRSQPFFGGAVVSFVRALGISDTETKIVYGAFDPRSADKRTPIWDLTPFVDLVDWTHAIRQFVATGDARLLAKRVATLGDRLARDWALGGRRGEPPRLREFSKALEEFGDALATVRVGELLLAKKNGPAACVKLAQTAEAAREEITRYAPPLAAVLGAIETMARELQIDQDHLAGEEGRRVMAALGRLYLRFGRFSEAAIALREGWINLYAGPEACRPGFDDYDEKARAAAERRWSGAAQQHRTIARVRNDLEHGGFRKRPDPAPAIREQLEWLVAEFEEAALPEPGETPGGVTWFVSRHPGAREWAARRGIAVDRAVAHLDVAQVRAGDTVIGTLPVNLAAEVCACGARYLHLSLDLPEAMRGRELSAEELEGCGARLEPFVVERPK
jgi:CRISPR-associated protein Csx16